MSNRLSGQLVLAYYELFQIHEKIATEAPEKEEQNAELFTRCVDDKKLYR